MHALQLSSPLKILRSLIHLYLFKIFLLLLPRKSPARKSMCTFLSFSSSTVSQHTHTLLVVMTLIGVMRSMVEWLLFVSNTSLVSPKLALYDQWERMFDQCFSLSLSLSLDLPSLSHSLSSTGLYRHLEDRLTVHIYYVECLAQGTYLHAHVPFGYLECFHTQHFVYAHLYSMIMK